MTNNSNSAVKPTHGGSRGVNRPFYTLQLSDVGAPTIRAFGHTWQVAGSIGNVLPGDVGKRVYESDGVLSIESVGQHMKRRARQRPVVSYEQRTKRPSSSETELLVLSGCGVRYSVLGHYGLGDEFHLFSAAVCAARNKLAAGHARAFVAIRIEAEVIDGFGDGTDHEFARFEVYADRVVLVPLHQGGLSDEQRVKALALSKGRLL
jgi:hypothetical protein